ncbi:MAG: pyridoxamine 5'-phosphate oxidase family protein [Lachnospiraceae bacterium]|nr:pyridoxamine 5'-phosphate oxidase family protein [Lachnospiraceae bacterium]
MREMRRKDRQLDQKEAERILSEGEYGILSTVGRDDVPYGVPVSYAYRDGVIYFHGTRGTSRKADNIAHQPKVCFTVVGNTEVLPEKFSTRYESVIVFGTALAARDKTLGLRLLQEKYSPGFKEQGQEYINASLDQVAVYEILVDDMTAKGRR